MFTTRITDPSDTRSRARPSCPQCGNNRPFKDGLRSLFNGDSAQRWRCRNCGYRYSDKQPAKPPQKTSKQSLNTHDHVVFKRQICAILEEAKNLTTATETKTVAGVSPLQDSKGKIVEYSFWMLKQGYSEHTIHGRTHLMKRLAKLGDIFNPENMKETIAKQSWSQGRKQNAVDAYTGFLQMQGLTWDPPTFNRIRKLPFIPTENEVDQLIGGCNKRMATFLQLLKETGARCGEACKLRWTDLDTENPSVRVTPEKGSNPRILKISPKLTSMLNALPKNYQTLFPINTDVLRKSYQRQRRLIAYKMQNPRLMQISFHTLRHFKATMEYHKTKDILHVMQVLGHRNINNTLVYTHLVNFREDDYVAKVAHSEKEVCELIEAGYEYVCEYGGNRVFRKRK